MLESYMAYAGTYDYDPETKTVTHHVQLSNDPTDLGSNLVRTVEFDGDRVTLTTTKPYDLAGEKVINKLTWQRLHETASAAHPSVRLLTYSGDTSFNTRPRGPAVTTGAKAASRSASPMSPRW
jgi:hypothetical protein